MSIVSNALNLFRRQPRRDTRNPLSSEPSVYVFDGKMVYQINGKNGGAYSGLLPTALQYQSRQKWGQDKQSYAMASATNAYVANAVNLITNDVTSIPYGVWDNATDTEAVNHPFMLAMKDNRKQRQQNLLQYVMRSYLIFGEAYVLPIKNGYGYHTGVQALNPLALEPFISNGQIIRFDYYGDRANVNYRPNEIGYWRRENVLDDLRGLSPLASAMDDVNIYREIQRYTLDQFLRDLKLSGILTGRGDVPVTETELNKALERLKEQANSRWAALNSSLEFKQVQQEFDASATNVSEDLRKSIAVALGIPHSIAGSWDSATYQSAPEQRKFYLQSVVGRYCEELATWLTDVVLPFYGLGNYEFYFDVETAIAPLEDQQSKANLATQVFQAGGISLNEYRSTLGHSIIKGGDYLIQNDQRVPLTLLPDGTYALPEPVQAPASAAPVTPEAVTPATAALPAPVPVVGKDAWVGLSLGNHPDLMSLQRTLQTRMADQEINWNKADDFHVTLIYAPAATDEQIATFKTALESVELPELALTVGSLAAFDNVGEYALHFRIKSNAALKELQEELYDLAIASGLQLSAYSDPASYKPHVTMGYGKQKLRVIPFSSKYRVKPTELRYMADKTLIHCCPCGTPVTASPIAKALSELPAVDEPSVNLLETPYEPFNAIDELRAWAKKIENKGYKSATPFTAYQIPATVADGLRSALAETGDDKDAIKAAFANAETLLAVKAIQATRIDFEDALDDLLKSIIAGGITKSRARVAWMNLIDVHGNKAARDGFEDAGVNREPDDDEQAEIDALIRQQRQYVNNLLNTLYSDEDSITPAMASQKPSLWFNGSIYPIYTLALGLADKNANYKWVLGNADKHCDSCLGLEGQVHPIKGWTKRGLLPKSSKLDCKIGCECSLRRTTEKTQGRY